MTSHREHGHDHDHDHRHGHAHHHGRTDIDWEVMADQLEDSGELQLPALRDTAARLRARLGPDLAVRRILDVGSGPGIMTCVFAEAFPAAEVIAIDGTQALLDRTLARAGRLGLADRVRLLRADLPDDLRGTALAADLGGADLVWSSMAVHHLGDQEAALRDLAGLLRPGGLLAVVEGGLPLRYLPRDLGIGRPGLLARLDAVQQDWFAEMRAQLPGSVPVVEDWPTMFTRAGLVDATAFSVLLDLPAPLGAAGRAFLHDHLSRLRDKLDAGVADDDRKVLDVLVDEAAPEGILNRPDAFLLTANTTYVGVRPGA